MTDRLTLWIDAYVRAWNSNDRADIEALFTPGAVYRHAPFEAGWKGRATIVRRWLARRDEPGETSFTWQPVSVGDDLAVVQGTTTYPDRTYSNLWVIRFAGDRCAEFTEWWMQHPVHKG